MIQKKYLIIVISLFLLSFGLLQLMARGAEPLRTEQISISPPYDETFDSIVGSIQSTVVNETVHVAWAETIPVSNYYDTDIYYGQLNGEETRNLSSHFPTSDSELYAIEISEDGDVCILWTERDKVVSDEISFVIWNNKSGDYIESSKYKLKATSEEGMMPQFNCDPSGGMTVVFIEDEMHLYMWDVEANTVSKLENDGEIYIHEFQRIDVDGVTYVAWSKGTNSYLWDSISKSAQLIGNLNVDFYLIGDGDGVVHMFWEALDPDFYQPYCWFHWNSVTETSEPFTPCNESEGYDLLLAKNEAGDIHAAWLQRDTGSTQIFSYRSLANDTVYEISNEPDIDHHNIKLLVGPDGVAHLIWRNEHDIHHPDLYDSDYYWNSDEQVITRLNGESEEMTILFRDWIQWDFDSENELHAAWTVIQDDVSEIRYWTPSLAMPISIELENSDVDFDFLLDRHDVAHLLFLSEADGLIYWNSRDLVETAVTTDPISYKPSSTYFNVVESSNDEPIVFFNPDQFTLHYWTPAGGESFLGNATERTYVHTNSGKFYMYWERVWGKVYATTDADNVLQWPASDEAKIYLPTIKK